MKAIVYERYGAPDEVFELREIEPPAVADDEALVRVRASSVNPVDWHYMRGEPYFMRAVSGLRAPKARVLGGDVAGRVEAVGPGVTAVRPGDEVFGSPVDGAFGTFAEMASVRADLLVPKPPSISFEQAAAVSFAGLTALQGLRDHGRVEAGQRVLVVGASGGVGTFAVQIAKALGAHVTGVCSTRNLDMVSSIGADEVIDYTREDFTRGTRRYDVIFQVAGRASPSSCRRALKTRGILVQCSGDARGRIAGPLGRLARAWLLSLVVSQRLTTFVARPKRDDLEVLRQLLESGAVTPVIDRTYPLDRVPEAIAYLEAGHAQGKIVITV